MPTPIPTAEQVTQAASKAEEAFWSAVAQEFPAITTGDLDPMIAMRFRDECEQVIRKWILTNWQDETFTQRQDAYRAAHPAEEPF